MPTKKYLTHGVPKNFNKNNGQKSKLFRTMNNILHTYNSSTSSSGKGTSFGTRKSRAKILNQMLNYLHDDKKFKIPSVYSLKQKHIDVVVEHWVDHLMPSTIQTRCSTLRTFCKWIGKHRLIIDPSRYSADESTYKRQSATSTDKTWEGQGVDFNEKVKEVAAKDPVVSAQLKLQDAFGLRAREAWLFKPYTVQKSYSVYIEHGTKGGRDRELDIIETHQLAVLDEVKIYVNDSTGSLIPSKYTLRQWEKHFYYICGCCGISRKDGIVPQGLRHGMANKLYQLYSGQPSPVKAKTLGIDIPDVEKRIDSRARYNVAQYMGHSRKQITSAYCGSIRSVKCSNNDDQK